MLVHKPLPITDTLAPPERRARRLRAWSAAGALIALPGLAGAHTPPVHPGDTLPAGVLAAEVQGTHDFTKLELQALGAAQPAAFRFGWQGLAGSLRLGLSDRAELALALPMGGRVGIQLLTTEPSGARGGRRRSICRWWAGFGTSGPTTWSTTF